MVPVSALGRQGVYHLDVTDNPSIAAKQKAVSRFWELLQDVVVLSAVPDHWCASLPDDHPFLRVVGGAVAVHNIAAAAQQGGG